MFKLPASWYNILLLVTGIVLVYTAIRFRQYSANLAILCGALGSVIVIHQLGKMYKRDLIFSSPSGSAASSVSAPSPEMSLPAAFSEPPPSASKSGYGKRYPLSEEFVVEDMPEMPPPPIMPTDIKP